MRRLKLRELRILMAVAQAGSMGKAATQLALSQPAVSKAIAEMEYTLGFALLDRTPQGVEPTLYGRSLLKWSAAVFDDLRQGVREIEFLADPGAGEVRVGSHEVMSAALLPAVIDKLSRQHPRLVFTVRQAGTIPLLYGDLRERRVDFIFGRMMSPIDHEDFHAEVLFARSAHHRGRLPQQMAATAQHRSGRVGRRALVPSARRSPHYAVCCRGVSLAGAQGAARHCAVEFATSALWHGSHGALSYGSTHVDRAAQRCAVGVEAPTDEICGTARPHRHCDAERIAPSALAHSGSSNAPAKSLSGRERDKDAVTALGNEITATLANIKLSPSLSLGVRRLDRGHRGNSRLRRLRLADGRHLFYLILASQFGSFLQPIAIMASLPLSLIGVFLGLLAWGSTLNIFSVVGFIMLMGLVVKNAILLVDFVNQAWSACRWRSASAKGRRSARRWRTR